MENARVIIVEDHPMLREGYRYNLEARNHAVVGEAESVDSARAMIDELLPDSVDVAVVDGNLSGHGGGGKDGERIISYIREKLGSITVLGVSFDGRVRGADINIDKQNPRALTDTIHAL